MPIRTPPNLIFDKSPARLAVYDGLARSPDLDMKALSLALGRNHAYIRQYLVEGRPEYLPEDDRKFVAQLLGIQESVLRGPGRLGRAAQAFDKRTNERAEKDLAELAEKVSMAADAQRIKTLSKTGLVGGLRDLPLYGTAEGGQGALVLSSEPVDSVLRPSPLANVREGYGVIITGESMVPLFRPGDIALVHPHLPARPDSEVVLQREDEGARYAIIKTLIRSSSASYRLAQYNPAKEMTVSKADWPICHLVVGKYTSR